jgi:hypothetical protein
VARKKKGKKKKKGKQLPKQPSGKKKPVAKKQPAEKPTPPAPPKKFWTRRRKAAGGVAGVFLAGVGVFFTVKAIFKEPEKPVKIPPGPRAVLKKVPAEHRQKIEGIYRRVKGLLASGSLKEREALLKDRPALEAELDRISAELAELEREALSAEERRNLEEHKSAIESRRLDLLVIKRGRELDALVRGTLPAFKIALERNWRKIFSSFQRVGPEEGGVIFFNPRTQKFDVKTVLDPVKEVGNQAIASALRGERTHLRELFMMIEGIDWRKNTGRVSDQGRPVPPAQQQAFLVQNVKRSVNRYIELKNRLEQARRSGRTAEVTFLEAEIAKGGFEGMFETIRVLGLDKQYNLNIILEKLFTQDRYFQGPGQRLWCTFHTHPEMSVQGARFPSGVEPSQNDKRNSVFKGPEVVFTLDEKGMTAFVIIAGKTVFSQSFEAK